MKIKGTGSVPNATPVGGDFAAKQKMVGNLFQGNPGMIKVNKMQTVVAKHADTRKAPTVTPVVVPVKKAEGEVVVEEQTGNFKKNLAAIAKAHQPKAPAAKPVKKAPGEAPAASSTSQPAAKDVEQHKINMKANQAKLAQLFGGKVVNQVNEVESIQAPVAVAVSKEKIAEMGQSSETGFFRSMWTNASHFMNRVKSFFSSALDAVNIFKYFRKNLEAPIVTETPGTTLNAAEPTSTQPLSAAPPPPPPPPPQAPKKQK